VFAIDGSTAEAFDVAGAIRALRSRADAKDEPYFAGRGFDGSRGFYDRFLRLGAVFVLCEGADGIPARYCGRTVGADRLPARAAQACLGCLRSDL